MGKAIHCNKCCGEIKHKSELIVVQEGFFGVAAYHDRCYGSASKGLKSFIMSKPLNSPEGILSFIIYNIIFAVMFYMVLDSNMDKGYLFMVTILLLYGNFNYFRAWYYYTRHFK